jgi:hypothetical protein
MAVVPKNLQSVIADRLQLRHPDSTRRWVTKRWPIKAGSHMFMTAPTFDTGAKRAQTKQRITTLMLICPGNAELLFRQIYLYINRTKIHK